MLQLKMKHQVCHAAYINYRIKSCDWKIWKRKSIVITQYTSESPTTIKDTQQNTLMISVTIIWLGFSTQTGYTVPTVR